MRKYFLQPASDIGACQPTIYVNENRGIVVAVPYKNGTSTMETLINGWGWADGLLPDRKEWKELKLTGDGLELNYIKAIHVILRDPLERAQSNITMQMTRAVEQGLVITSENFRNLEWCIDGHGTPQWVLIPGLVTREWQEYMRRINVLRKHGFCLLGPTQNHGIIEGATIALQSWNEVAEFLKPVKAMSFLHKFWYTYSGQQNNTIQEIFKSLGYDINIKREHDFRTYNTEGYEKTSDDMITYLKTVYKADYNFIKQVQMENTNVSI